MDTKQFLDYLDEHAAGCDLAAEVADLLASRRERSRTTSPVAPVDPAADARVAARVAS